MKITEKVFEKVYEREYNSLPISDIPMEFLVLENRIMIQKQLKIQNTILKKML